jgi:cysteinyl-tRNA synthetase
LSNKVGKSLAVETVRTTLRQAQGERPELNFTSIPQNSISKSMLDALCDDLNTPKAIGIIFENLVQIKQNPELLKFTKSILVKIFGLSLQPIKEEQIEITPEIQELINQREQARVDKNWALADKLRDQLKSLGYEARDTRLKN